MRVLAVLLFCLLFLTPCMADVYKIRPDISEQELNSLYVDMLLKFTKHAEDKWQEAGPGLGYWGTGRSDWNNEGIRAISTTSLAYAVLVKHSNVLNGEQRKLYLTRAISGIRYAALTHRTGNLKCTDDKQWGNSWQSTFWASNFGLAAWIVWDDLDTELKKSVEKVVVYEADRLLTRTPPGKRFGDTKAEENAWDQMVVSLATNMFPDHPNASGWRDKSIQFMMNTLSVPQDLKDERIVDGKPVKEWVVALNAHSDFTMENHGFFHPSYTMVSPAMVGQGAFFYAFAGNPLPQATAHHLMDNWRTLQTVMLPHSYWAYIQGMDWALNSDGHIHYLAWLATYSQDPLAAGMEKTAAQYIAGHQSVHEDGSFAGPASRLKFGREAITAERITYSYLYHKYINKHPQQIKTIRNCASELNGVRRYTLVEVITHRTNSKFFSFSWKNRVMGYAMPIGKGHEGNPYFCTPLTNGLVGSFVLEKDAKGLQVTSRKWQKTDNGFATEGIIKTNGGLLQQEIKVISAGEKTVIYIDKVTALSDIKITQELGVPLGIENDEFTGNQRTLYCKEGSKTVRGPETEEMIRTSGNWINIDGRLGMVSLSGSGIVYKDVANYNRDGAREDFLYCSYSDAPGEFKAGSEVARRIAVLYLETDSKETAGLSKQSSFDGKTLTVPLPEGGVYIGSL